MINAELARAFDRIADLLEIEGGDRFRINSYRRAARTLQDTHEDIAVLAAENRLDQLPGIGKGTAGRIHQYLDSGKIDVLTELEAKFPPGLPELLTIPGLGPKKVAVLHRELSIAGLDDLKNAIAAGKVAELAGFGATSVQRILEGIEFLEQSAGRTPLGIALPLAELLAGRVRELKGVQRVDIAGSTRRGEETIGDIDLVCAADEGDAVVAAFSRFDGVRRVLASGPTKASVIVGLATGGAVQVDLRVVPGESFGAALQYFTGSKAHNVRLREIALKKKWRLNEYGLYHGDKVLAGAAEEDIYARLGVPWVPPELRQDRGEFEEGFAADKLLTLSDIRGDLHMHTTASDGKNSIEEMAEAAKRLGYHTIAICDHSRSSVIANGLSIERMKAHVAAIRQAAARTTGIAILAGCECDILPDGSLDYPDDLLAQCDLVVASIHLSMSRGGSGKLSATERTLAAIANPYVTIIGHPTGRLIGKRDAMEMDMARVIEAAARNGTVLEVNAAWQRLDLKGEHVRQAIAAGAMLAINTDAHATGELDRMRYGVLTARRGGATAADVLNTFTTARLRKRISAKRGGKAR